MSWSTLRAKSTHQQPIQQNKTIFSPPPRLAADAPPLATPPSRASRRGIGCSAGGPSRNASTLRARWQGSGDLPGACGRAPDEGGTEGRGSADVACRSLPYGAPSPLLWRRKRCDLNSMVTVYHSVCLPYKSDENDLGDLGDLGEACAETTCMFVLAAYHGGHSRFRHLRGRAIGVSPQSLSEQRQV